MIKYHGTPITPKVVFEMAMINRNCLIPFFDSRDLSRALKLCNKVIIDNSAFSIWRNNLKVDWNEFYLWIQPFKDKIEFFFIPDVIDGTEYENNLLIEDYHSRGETKGVPVWHLNESFGRLEWLMSKFDYIALGSSGDYDTLGTTQWNRRMNDVMKVVCDIDGYPLVKIHMLRCLNPDIFLQYPFYSGDSTNLAQNHSTYNTVKGNKKKGINPSNDGWKVKIKMIEKYNSPLKYDMNIVFSSQGSLFDFS